MMMTRPPAYILQILNTLDGAGYDARLVGGCVRDRLLGRRPGDWDIASSAAPEAVLALFPRALPTGLRHGTVTVRVGSRQAEVTAFRTEGGYTDRRHPDYVNFTHSLADDLARRDFTVNAMAMSADGAITDLFGGRADLRARLLRCVGDPAARFSEDALRMLRAFRFSAQLGFSIEAKTLSALEENAHLAAVLSPERVRDELLKTLYSPRPEVLGEMADAGLLDAFLRRGTPDLSRLHTLPHYARPAHLGRALEAAGCIMSTKDFFLALRTDAETAAAAGAGAAILAAGSRDWKRLLRDYGEAAVRAAHPRSRALKSILTGGECWSLKTLAVNGGDLLALGLSGPALGRTLDRLLEHVIDYPEDNRKNTLCKLALREETIPWKTGKN